MDVLSDVLNSVRLWGEVICRFELTAPWGVSIPAVDGAVFHVVDRGSCWLRIKGEENPVPMAGGDLMVFPRGTPHEIVDVPSSLSLPLEELLCTREPDSLLLPHGGGGAPATIICGVFHLHDVGEHALFSLLPPIIHIPGDQGQTVPWLAMTLKFMSSEAGSPHPGSDIVIGRLTDILFIQAVRTWIEGQANGRGGWLTGLHDAQIGPSLGHMHRAPEDPWTVASLAARVGMSRSAFSARFSALIGEPPLQYLTSWRMRLARGWLRDTDMSLAEIAERVGYQSEDPFKRAFKRIGGVPPSRYRREARTSPVTSQASQNR